MAADIVEVQLYQREKLFSWRFIAKNKIHLQCIVSIRMSADI